MHKVLYITYDGLTDALGQSQVLPYLAGLTKHQFDFTIISCEKPAKYVEQRERVLEICKRSDIKWHAVPYTKRPPILSTVKDLAAIKRKAVQLQRQNHFEIVHCRSYIPALIGLHLKKRFGTKFVFDMRGFWADERIDAGAWSMKNPVYKWMYRFFKRKESEFLKAADAVITLTDAARTEMASWPGTPVEGLEVIPCCADFEHFDFHRVSDEESKEQRRVLGISPNSIVISYLGSLGTWYLAKEMLEFFKLLKETHANAHLLFITNDEPATIKQMAADEGISAESLTAVSARREDLPRVLSVTDINYFFIKPSYSKMASSPTKLAEVLGMGKPVICNFGVGDIEAIFRDGVLGIAIDVYDKSTWTLAIQSVGRLLASDREQIRARGIAMFGLDRGVNAYCDIYQRLTVRSSTESN